MSTGTFRVMRERCDQCLYGPNKIVDDDRRRQIIRDLHRTDGWFICHKASIANERIACRGDWDQRVCGQLGRIAGRIGMVRFEDLT